MGWSNVKILGFAAPFGMLVSGCQMAGTLKPDQGKLLATGGVSQVEGAGGSGLTTWSLISGYGSEDSFGAAGFHSRALVSDFELSTTGAAIGLRDRLEISYAHQEFATGDTGPKLGLRDSYTFEQDVIGAKLRVIGNAVYDQDSWMPQVAIGAQYKKSGNGDLVRALGATDDEGLDLYVSATKLLLEQNLILAGTVRRTNANQLGLLGFGGDQGGHSLQVEATAAYMVRHNVVVGADYRSKPDNLGFAEEQDAVAAYVAFFPSKNMSITAGAVDLGDVALQGRQRGAYASLQVGF